MVIDLIQSGHIRLGLRDKDFLQKFRAHEKQKFEDLGYKNQIERFVKDEEQKEKEEFKRRAH